MVIALEVGVLMVVANGDEDEDGVAEVMLVNCS